VARLFGAQRMVLQALLDAQGETSAFIEDSRIAQATNISPRDMRDWLLTLDHDELVDLALTENGMSASGTAKGRLALGLYRPFPTPTALESLRSRSKTGRESACHRHQRLPITYPTLARRRQRRAGDGAVTQFRPGPVPRPVRPLPR
jgi:hypothetical protein